jgi:protocatechuate 3,4-dioxygenase, beta subunit
MDSKINTWRRKLNGMLVALPTLLVPLKSHSQTPSLSQGLTATPQDGEGPFYPKQWDGELDNNLLNFNGKQYANGTPMTLSGKLFSVTGEALVGATVELWQCDEIGEYRHPRSAGDAPAQRGFQGFARMISDSDGHYDFRTLKPVPYNGRPAHVHFRVIAPGHRTLTTQMYFAGENEEGTFLLRLYKFFGGFSKQRDLLTATAEKLRVGERDEINARFDMILERSA